MFRHIESISLSLLMILLASGCSKSVSFSADIQPILSKHCLECHKKGEQGHEKSGLSMDTYAELMSGTRYGPVIVPGNSISSTLFRLIDHKANKAINMPHDKSKIPDNEIALIKAWIDEGAKNN
ncbi:MAG TPA: c-type cytochrome domain-containing protein [Gammaproteobacteria bacterium]